MCSSTVSRGDTRCTLCCNIVDAKVRPLLEWKACVGMKLIQMLDSDDVRPPNTEGCPVFTVNRPTKPLTKSMLEMKFPTVSADGVGKLEGEHHIHLDLSVDPVQKAPRSVQILLRAKLWESLDDQVCQEVLAPLSE